VLIDAFGIAPDRVGKNSDLGAHGFGDDVELATGFTAAELAISSRRLLRRPSALFAMSSRKRSAVTSTYPR
jgi:hypothetical protein